MASDGAVPLLVLIVTLLAGCPQASQQPLPSAPPGGGDHESTAPGARGATPAPTAGSQVIVVPGPVTPEPAVPPPPTVEAVRTSTHVTPRRLRFSAGNGRCVVDAWLPEVRGLAASGARRVGQILAKQMGALPCRGRRQALSESADLDAACASGSVYWLDYSVQLDRAELLSLTFGGTDCQPVQAHPNDWSDGVTIDLRTQQVVRFADLFRPGADLRGIIDGATPDEGCSGGGYVDGDARAQDFAFTPTGLLFVDIATGAMRSCTSTVPFEELAEWARPGGALGPFVPTAATSPSSTAGSSTDTLPDCPRRLPRAGTVCAPTRFEACAYERADPACEGATLATCSDGRWETECNW